MDLKDAIIGWTLSITFILSFIVLIILKIMKIADAPWWIIFVGGFFVCFIAAAAVTIPVVIILKIIYFIRDRFF